MNTKKLYKSIKENMGASYYLPLSFKEGLNYQIKDIDDKEYIDLSSGYAVTNIGYNNPEMISSQIEFLSSLYPFELSISFFKLISVLPSLKRI